MLAADHAGTRRASGPLDKVFASVQFGLKLCA